MMQQTHTTLSNGLQSFADISPDYALAPVGIGSFKEQADKLAEYGRNGDVYVVHAAEGETVVPIEVLEANPKVKELLFGQMREMGLDPEEFIVGNELNSINPTTGMPEFFFKKIFRAVKKAVKKVVGFVKKAAPVILPIAAAAFGIPFLPPALFGAGTFGASFIGGGLGSLASGKSLKDSFKSGLISGGIASLTGGLKGAFGYGPKATTGFEGFKEGLGQTVGMGPEGYINPGFSDQVDRLAKGEFGDFISAKPYLDPSVPLPSTSFIQPAALDSSSSAIKVLPEHAYVSGGSSADIVEGGMGDDFLDAWDADKGIVRNIRQLSPGAEASYTPVGKDTLYGKVAERAASNVAKQEAFYDLGLNKTYRHWSEVPRGTLGAKEIMEAGKKAVSAAQPGMLQQWGPAAVVGAGTLYTSGALDPPPPPKKPTTDDLPGYSEETGMDMYRRTPGDYQLAQIYTPETAERLGIQFDYDPTQTMFGATGGLASFPRRDGAISGPGTERSDDIPAMLSDGEFVMTSKAVRGAAGAPTGNKELDRRNGAKNMYNMMRNFEMRA